jgi:aspartate aminotransferase
MSAASSKAARPSGLVQRVTDPERLKSQSIHAGADYHALNRGDPGFDTPAHICDAARQAMRDGFNHYVPGAGDADLIAAICDGLNREYGAGLTSKGVVITNGAAEAVFLACSSYLSPGDEMLLFDPEYSSYEISARLVQAVPVRVPMTRDFRVDFDRLRASISPRTKAILFSNPNNPTGHSLRREEMEGIAELAEKHDFLIISDEVYRKLYYDGVKHVSATSLPEVRHRTILIDSFSKTYAMPGWRIGYVATTPELAAPMAVVHRSTLSCINWPAQRGALAALTGSQQCVDDMLAEYARRRLVMLDCLKAMKGLSFSLSDSAFYFFPRYDGNMPAREMMDYLLGRKVVVRSGTEFGRGGEHHLRLTYASATCEQIRAGMRAMDDALQARSQA